MKTKYPGRYIFGTATAVGQLLNYLLEAVALDSDCPNVANGNNTNYETNLAPKFPLLLPSKLIDLFPREKAWGDVSHNLESIGRWIDCKNVNNCRKY